ncbi:putative arabinose efflux permease, MFS family [Streptoalloteichus tenebrarius]|uniref:Arabinose efflux permease, MFS family n=1 Tax=Streptoalloteichus tenebrarius (strain ATCC 17920 / DSM 40477 / JCM 4838 / CBS 697.72 / NBRC 16177 / NCIMB 11028 / NRRL B-12390 / A12253. 1 / ISP 5477) TaxID=1933 RepID=A0ABT1HLY5_STRSD|nr:MFS transporter [Streptoalloteichus tenebrarius]MCP2256513.1 putative arabinose efflux permease, MFS family [Streptoalloteichus tenebrarius]BFF04864.1 MFS transporter [Streptoalloteichus tenebrarius]
MPQSAPGGAPSTAVQVWLLALGMFAIGTDLFIVSGLLPALGRDLDLSTAAAGQTVTVFAITYAVAAPILAGLTGTVDRRALLVAVLAVFSVGNVLSAVAPSYGVLLLSRFVAGAGAALFAATASGVAARIAAPDRRGRALAIVYAGMTSAIALGVPIGNAIGTVLSWRWAFGFVTLLAVVSAVGLLASVPSLPGTGGAGIRERLGAVRVHRAPSALLVTTLWVLGTFVVYTYLGTLLDDVTHASGGVRPWLLLLFGVGSFAGVMAGGRLADRVNPAAGLGVSVGVLAVVLAAQVLALRSVPGAAVGLAVWGLVHWASFPLIQHRLLDIGGSHGDMLLALNNSAVYVGQTAAAALGGLFASAGLLTALPLAGAGCQLLALLVLALTARARRSPARSVEVVEALARR